MGKITLIFGGARSGKSTFAEMMAEQRSSQVLYMATAEPDDQEMVDRIQKHQEQRPESWQTREIPQQLVNALHRNPPTEDVVILDCVTLLISNVIIDACGSIDEPDEQASQTAVRGEIHQLLDFIQSGNADWIIVTNEVGLGLVPPYPLGRVYRDLLGWTNKEISRHAEEIFFLLGGRVLPLHDISRGLDDYFPQGD